MTEPAETLRELDDKHGVKIDSSTQIDNSEFSPVGWLKNNWTNKEEGWLLAFLDDGLIWGKMLDGKIEFSTVKGESVAELKADRLQQVSLFDKTAELRLWKEKTNWNVCKISDIDPINGEGESFDEKYILWGNCFEQKSKHFSIASDGQQGLKHAVPLINIASGELSERPLYLKVRNYIGYQDENKEAYVKASRLVALGVKGGK